MKKKEENDSQFNGRKASVLLYAQNPSLGVRATTHRRRDALSTTSGPIVVAAVFCLVFLVMGSAFSFSTFASELGRDLKAGSGSISFIFGCAMALLYGGGLFSGALADRIGTHRTAGAGALLCGGSLVAAGAVGTVWEADVTLGAGFGLGLAICYTPAVAAVQPWFDRNRGIASGIALSGTGLGTLLMPLLARWLIEDEGWRVALILSGSGWPVSATWPRIGSGAPGFAADIFISTVFQLSSQARPRPEVSAALPRRVPVVSRAPRPDRSYDPSRCSRGRGTAGTQHG